MTTYRIDREAYKAWRKTCPPELLSPTSQIGKWLDTQQPAPQERPTAPGKREVVAAGIAWRKEHPGETRRVMKIELAARFNMEIKGGWVDDIMDGTPDVPTNKGGRQKHP